MEKTLYTVTTTYFGADKPTTLYFDAEEKAIAELKTLENGEVESVTASGDYINYSDGCTYNDLTMGGLYKITIA